MCIPVAVAGMAFSAFQVGTAALMAATTVASAYAQNKQANAQAKAIESNNIVMQVQRDEQMRQVNQQSAQKESEVSRQATIERAKLQTLAGESGVSGGALDRLNAELNFREADALGSIETNRFNTAKQVDLQGRAASAEAQSRINSLNKPTWLGTGLQIVGAGLGGLGTGTPRAGSTYTGILKQRAT